MSLRPPLSPSLWGILSRTRPLPPRSSQRPPPNPAKGAKSPLKGATLYYSYQGIGVTAPFGLCYVIGVVVEGVGGEGVVEAVFLAMFTSLLTGLCFAELVTSNRQSSGNASTAIYQLVGEFPAYCAAVLGVVVSCSCFAAMSKALSSTMTELGHHHFRSFVSNIVGTLPFSGMPPDILAFGAALVSSVLLACGLKQAGFLRTTMNAFCVFGFIFFLSVAGSHSRAPRSTEEHKFESHKMVAGAGTLCCLFIQSFELGRRSKKQLHPRIILPLAIFLTTIGVLLASLALGIVLSLIVDNSLPVSGAPLLQALQLVGVDWARLVMGSIQVIVIGLGISEAGEIVCRYLVTMASDGFIPSFVTIESPLAFSHSRANLMAGVGASILALISTHVYLLEFMAANILLLNILVVLVVLYRPFRCSHDSLCSIAVTPASRRSHTLTPTSRLRPDTTSSKNSERTIQFLKSGINVLSFAKSHSSSYTKDEELGIPLLSMLHSTNEENRSEDIQSSKEGLENTARVPNILTGPPIKNQRSNEPSPTSALTNTAANNEENLLNKGDESALRTDTDVETKSTEFPSPGGGVLTLREAESEEESQEYDEFIQEDIDRIVSEYKEQLRISTLGTRWKSVPTQVTARRAFVCVAALTLISFMFSIFILYIMADSKTRLELKFVQNIFIMIILIIVVAILVFLTNLPKMAPLQLSASGFQMPAKTWLSFVALFLNILLFTELLSRTVWSLLPLYISAVIWYAVYGSRRSAVATSQIYEGLRQSPEDGMK